MMSVKDTNNQRVYISGMNMFIHAGRIVIIFNILVLEYAAKTQNLTEYFWPYLVQIYCYT